MNNDTYWSLNLPLQVSQYDDGDIMIFNYMPRKECVQELALSECNEDDQAIDEFLETAAKYLRNLARLFDESAAHYRETGKVNDIYYHDEGMDK